VIGSSNFTSPGTGVGKVVNFEANLAYLFDCDRAPKGSYADLERRFPASEVIDDPEKRLLFTPVDDAGLDSAAAGPLLPSGFISAVYRLAGVCGAQVELAFGDDLPPGWVVLSEDERALLTEQEWESRGSGQSQVVAWSGRPPSGFWVSWHGAAGKAWWPVNVGSGADLPPPDDLRDLSLEVLIDLLTSARPLHEAMRKHLQRRRQGSKGAGPDGVELDPHKRVDTSGFLLQRTRRFSWALSGMRTRMERPVPTEECLRWRIDGPVGVMAVASALIREASGSEERTFLLAELALELVRVRPQDIPGTLSADKVRGALQSAAQAVFGLIAVQPDHGSAHLRRYVEGVAKRVGGG
jgi:hypothetical protein